jgi:hypothetical protein
MTTKIIALRTPSSGISKIFSRNFRNIASPLLKKGAGQGSRPP